mgnify:CR=1 FL=1
MMPKTERERINKERDAGISYKEISDNLNKDEIPTLLRGKKWYASTVRDIYLRYKSSS